VRPYGVSWDFMEEINLPRTFEVRGKLCDFLRSIIVRMLFPNGLKSRGGYAPPRALPPKEQGGCTLFIALPRRFVKQNPLTLFPRSFVDSPLPLFPILSFVDGRRPRRAWAPGYGGGGGGPAVQLLDERPLPLIR